MNNIIAWVYPSVSQIHHVSVITVGVEPPNVGPHVGKSSASNSNSGNSIRRGYWPPTNDGYEHNLTNHVMKLFRVECSAGTYWGQ